MSCSLEARPYSIRSHIVLIEETIHCTRDKTAFRQCDGYMHSNARIKCNLPTRLQQQLSSRCPSPTHQYRITRECGVALAQVKRSCASVRVALCFDRSFT